MPDKLGVLIEIFADRVPGVMIAIATREHHDSDVHYDTYDSLFAAVHQPAQLYVHFAQLAVNRLEIPANLADILADSADHEEANDERRDHGQARQFNGEV